MNDLERMLKDMEAKGALPVVQEEVYVKPVLKELTQEEIDEIHQRGMITPREMLEELNGMQYCPYTNGCSRCYEFANCDDCLIDHVNSKNEWMSFAELVSLFQTDTIIEEVVEKPKMLVRE